MTLEDLNPQSQAVLKHSLFNRWDQLPEAWYFVCRTEELPQLGVRKFDLLHQRVVLYRTATGQTSAIDAFCPHMGLDLSLGRVRGENIQCYFHHWEYSGTGHCKKIPALKKEYSGEGVDLGLRSYPTCEKYGLIWVYSGAKATVPVLEVPDLEGQEVEFQLGTINQNQSHHHISMINGLDPQHLKSVHGLNIDMEVTAREMSEQIEFQLTGELSGTSSGEKFLRWLLGPSYSYSMKYSQASVASLTLLRDVYFLKPRWSWPRLHMLYAYRPVRPGLSETLPIYVTRKRSGLFGKIKSAVLLALTRWAYYSLKSEDDKVYDHIRFNSRNLLKMDAPIQTYIQFVNALKTSIWSQSQEGVTGCREHKVDIESTVAH